MVSVKTTSSSPHARAEGGRKATYLNIVGRVIDPEGRSRSPRAFILDEEVHKDQIQVAGSCPDKRRKELGHLFERRILQNWANYAVPWSDVAEACRRGSGVPGCHGGSISLLSYAGILQRGPSGAGPSPAGAYRPSTRQERQMITVQQVYIPFRQECVSLVRVLNSSISASKCDTTFSSNWLSQLLPSLALVVRQFDSCLGSSASSLSREILRLASQNSTFSNTPAVSRITSGISRWLLTRDGGSHWPGLENALLLGNTFPAFTKGPVYPIPQ